jgi:hypothetical protein
MTGEKVHRIAQQEGNSVSLPAGYHEELEA